MIPISIVTEDIISEKMTERLISEAKPSYSVKSRYPKTGRISSSRGNAYIEKNIAGFNNAGRSNPFFVLLDLDNRECAPSYVNDLLPNGPHRYFLLRVAVTEIESWLLADREAFSTFLDISKDLVPQNPDQLPDAKAALFGLVRKSRKRKIKEAILPHHATAHCGPNYNGELVRYLNNYWDSARAALQSQSLSRTIRALDRFSYP